MTPAPKPPLTVVGDGDRVAVAVDHREMGRLALLVRRDAGLNLLRRRRLVGQDRGADARGVVLAQQAIERIADEGRIAEIGVAVDEGVAHRLDHQMNAGGRMKAEPFEVVAFEDVENFAQGRAAGGGRRGRDEAKAAIVAGERRRLADAVGGEVGGGQDSAVGAHRRVDLLGDRAAIEGVRALVGDRLQRRGEVALDQAVAGLERRTVGAQEDLRRFGIAFEARRESLENVGVGAAENEAVARQRDRRRHDLGAAHRAVFLERRVEAENRARRGDGAPAVEARALDRRAGGVEIHRLGRRRRRGFAEVDEHVAMRRREMGDEESAAAEVAAAGIGHRLGEADRDRRVDRVAALAQNVGADLRRAALGGDDHAVLGLDRRPRGGARRPGRKRGERDSERDERTRPLRAIHPRMLLSRRKQCPASSASGRPPHR